VPNELTNFGSNSISSTAFHSNGNLYVGAGSDLYSLDMHSLEANLIGSLGTTAFDFAACTFPNYNPELTVTQTAFPNTVVDPGDEITYTITIENTGDIVLTGLNFEEIIPNLG